MDHTASAHHVGGVDLDVVDQQLGHRDAPVSPGSADARARAAPAEGTFPSRGKMRSWKEKPSMVGL